MAADIATYAKANYEHNFGMQVQGDICDIDPSTIEPGKLSGIYALHPRAIKVAPRAELIREDEGIELIDLSALGINAVPEPEPLGLRDACGAAK